VAGVRTLLSLTLVAALGATASGCGAGDADPASVASAAEVTRKARTAQVDLRMTAKGFGLPGEVSIRGDGTTSLDSARMALDLDLGPVLALAGAQGGDGTAKLVVRGGDVYVDPPQVEGVRLPGGASWLRVDLARIVESAGADAEALAEVTTVDPATQLDVLRSAKGVEEVGAERVGGAETTHLRGEVRLSDYARTLPPERRRKALAAIDQLSSSELGTDANAPTPFDVWVDEQDRIRRMTQRGKVPGQPGVPAGEFAITMELGGFGAALEADAPPRGDVYDATGVVTDAAASGGATGR
jgi:hypothetical protein